MLAGVLDNHDHPELVPALLRRAERLLDGAYDRDSIERARLWQWQGFNEYVVKDQPRYVGNPLIKAATLMWRSFPHSDDLVVTLLQMSMLAIADQKYDAAQSVIDELRVRAVQRYGEQNMYVTQVDVTEGNLDLRTGHPDKAYAVWTRGVDATRHFEGEHHDDALMFQAQRITALLSMQRIDDALTLWADADAQRERDWPQDDELHAAYDSIAEQLR